jgi:hypothetical protein
VDPIDRELASLLSVEPSPEFRARVRARIASEPAPRSWYVQWLHIAASCAAAAVVVAGIAIIRVAPTRPAKGNATPVAIQPPLPSRAAVSAAEPAQVAEAPPYQGASHGKAPEVIADATAARGLRQLDALVRDGRTQLVFPDERVVPEPPSDIVITPIAIAPIEVGSVSEQVGDSEGDQP